MRDRIDDMAGASVVVITFTAPANLAAYQDALDPALVVTDTDRRAYQAFGLERGTRRRVWRPNVWRQYYDLLRAGRRLQRPTEDLLQLGGDFVVAPDGTIAWAYPSEGPDDRPCADTIVRAVADCRE